MSEYQYYEFQAIDRPLTDKEMGDLRALYLGWLLCMQNREISEEELEPPIPPEIGQLSASLESLARFLRIDDDLLYVAAKASPTMEEVRPSPDEVRTWVAKLPAIEKNEMLARLIADEDPTVVTELHKRFLAESSAAGVQSPAPLNRRTVGELLRAAQARAQERRQVEAKRRVEAHARREQEAAIALGRSTSTDSPCANRRFGPRSRA